MFVTTADRQAKEPANVQDLSEPLIDQSEGQLFLTETFKIIMEEVLCKGTDVKEKVSPEAWNPSPVSLQWLFRTKLNPFFFLQVCEWKEPEELALLLDLELRATGEPQHRLLQRVKDVAKYSIKTSKTAGDSWNSWIDLYSLIMRLFLLLLISGHPRFFNQQFAGVDYHSLAGRFLTEALNTNL